MQSFDENDQPIRSGVLKSYKQFNQELNDPEVAHVTVGKLPKKGDVVLVNGLRYKAITGRNQIKKDKRLILELL